MTAPVALRGKHQTTLAQRITSAGLHLLDGTGMEWGGIGFAGTKRFIGGFGRGALTAFGEPEIKTFVKVSIDESLKLETALSQLRTPKRVVVLGPPFIEKMEARSTNRWQHRLKRERPTCTERIRIAPRECGWKHGVSGRLGERNPNDTPRRSRIDLTPTGPLMEGDYTH